MTTGILTTLGVVLVLILLDSLLGIILSIKARIFNVRKLPQFLATNLLPYVGGLLVLALATYVAGDYSAQVAAIFFAAAAATAAKFLTEIKDKVAQIFGKLYIPDSVNIKNPETLDINTIIDKIVEAMRKSTTG
jgi:hypothetical protein